MLLPLIRLVLLLGILLGGEAALLADELPIEVPEDAYGLELVKDGALSSDDNPAYYGLLNHASLVSPEALAKAGRAFLAERKEKTKFPTFLDMFKNPKVYRGKPVYLKGHILQTQKYDAIPNDYGIETLYEVSLFIEDAQAHPITVIFLEKPENLKIGGDMVDGIRVAGYFLKAYHYPSSDKHTRIAPLILANTVQIRPAPKPKPVVSSTFAYTSLFVVFGLLVIIVWYTQLGDRKRMLKRQHQEIAEAPNLKNIDVPDMFPSSDPSKTTNDS